MVAWHCTRASLYICKSCIIIMYITHTHTLSVSTHYIWWQILLACCCISLRIIRVHPSFYLNSNWFNNLSLLKSVWAAENALGSNFVFNWIAYWIKSMLIQDTFNIYIHLQNIWSQVQKKSIESDRKDLISFTWLLSTMTCFIQVKAVSLSSRCFLTAHDSVSCSSNQVKPPESLWWICQSSSHWCVNPGWMD